MVDRDRDREDLYDRMARVSQEAAVAAERERQLEDKVRVLETEMEELKDLVARGRGVLLVVLSLGSLLGILLGAWDKIARLFGGAH